MRQISWVLVNYDFMFPRTYCVAQWWHVVDCIPIVSRTRNTESELEIEAFYELTFEVMTLDHAEIFALLLAYCKYQAGWENY